MVLLRQLSNAIKTQLEAFLAFHKGGFHEGKESFTDYIDTAKGMKQLKYFRCFELCLYSIRELAAATPGPWDLISEYECSSLKVLESCVR